MPTSKIQPGDPDEDPVHTVSLRLNFMEEQPPSRPPPPPPAAAKRMMMRRGSPTAMSNMYASPPDSPVQGLATPSSQGSEGGGGGRSRSGDMSPMFTRQTKQSSGRGQPKRGGGVEGGGVNKETMRRNMLMQNSFDLQAIHRIDLKSSFDQQFSSGGFQRWNHSRNGDRDSSFSGSQDGRITEPSTPILVRRKPESSTGGSVMPPAKTPPNPGNPPSSKKTAMGSAAPLCLAAPVSPSESFVSKASFASSFGSGHRLTSGSARKLARASDSEGGNYDHEDGDVSPFDGAEAGAAAKSIDDHDHGDGWRPSESLFGSTQVSPVMAIRKGRKDERGAKPVSEKLLLQSSRPSGGGSTSTSPAKQGKPLAVEIETPKDGRVDDSRGQRRGMIAGLSAESSGGESEVAAASADGDDCGDGHDQGRSGSDREEEGITESLIHKLQKIDGEVGKSRSDKMDGMGGSDAGFANRQPQAPQAPSSKAQVSPSGGSGRGAEAAARGWGRHLSDAQQGAWHGPVSRGGASASPQSGGGGSATPSQSPTAPSGGIEGISLVAGIDGDRRRSLPPTFGGSPTEDEVGIGAYTRFPWRSLPQVKEASFEGSKDQRWMSGSFDCRVPSTGQASERSTESAGFRDGPYYSFESGSGGSRKSTFDREQSSRASSMDHGRPLGAASSFDKTRTASFDLKTLAKSNSLDTKRGDMKTSLNPDGAQRIGSNSAWEPPIVDPGHRNSGGDSFMPGGMRNSPGLAALLEELERERAASRRAEADLARVLDEVGVQIARSRKFEEENAALKKVAQGGLPAGGQGQRHNRPYAAPEDEEVQRLLLENLRLREVGEIAKEGVEVLMMELDHVREEVMGLQEGVVAAGGVGGAGGLAGSLGMSPGGPSRYSPVIIERAKAALRSVEEYSSPLSGSHREVANVAKREMETLRSDLLEVVGVMECELETERADHTHTKMQNQMLKKILVDIGAAVWDESDIKGGTPLHNATTPQEQYHHAGPPPPTPPAESEWREVRGAGHRSFGAQLEVGLRLLDKARQPDVGSFSSPQPQLRLQNSSSSSSSSMLSKAVPAPGGRPQDRGMVLGDLGLHGGPTFNTPLSWESTLAGKGPDTPTGECSASDGPVSICIKIITCRVSVPDGVEVRGLPHVSMQVKRGKGWNMNGGNKGGTVVMRKTREEGVQCHVVTDGESGAGQHFLEAAWGQSFNVSIIAPADRLTLTVFDTRAGDEAGARTPFLLGTAQLPAGRIVRVSSAGGGRGGEIDVPLVDGTKSAGRLVVRLSLAQDSD